MAVIVDIATRRKAVPISAAEIMTAAVEHITGLWERSARVNKLNEFFVTSVPWAIVEGANYLEDLTALSSTERRLGIEIQTTAPGFSEALGWTASAKIAESLLTTAPMPTEQYARALLILLHTKIKRDLEKV